MAVCAPGLAVDYHNERLYWADAKLSVIGSIRLNGTDPVVAIDNKKGEQSTVGAAGRRLTCAGATSPGSHLGWVPPLSGRETPAHRPSAASPQPCPRQHLAGRAACPCADLTGPLLTFPGLSHPFSIDIFEDYIYGVTYINNRIFKIHKFGHKSVTNLTSGLNHATDVVLYHQYKQPEGACWPWAPPASGGRHLIIPMRKGRGNWACLALVKELGKEKAWGGLIVALQYLKGAYEKDRERLFTRAGSDRTTGMVLN